MAPRSAFASLFQTPHAKAPAWTRWGIVFLGTFFVLVHLYAGIYGPPEVILFRTVHVSVALALIFLCFPLKRAWHGRLNAWTVLDGLGIAGCAWLLGYFLIELDTWELRFAVMRPVDTFTGVLLTVLVLEAVRRTVGWILVVIALFFVIHALNADHFPGFFYGPPATFDNLLQAVFIGDSGIFGIPVGVMAQFVVLFILFGQLLSVCGGGAFFTRLAFAIFGHRVGGPAKAAVVSSAMMGSISGSAIGNVMTTGAFTIPMMKRLGYRPDFAGGVEAAASNGGIVMPPVMGAVAFIMAEFLDRPYAEIALAAAIPALLYFLVIFVTVHYEAKKHNLGRLDKADLPKAWPILKSQGYLALPLVLIIITLVLGYSIVLVAVVTIAATFLLSFVRASTRMTPMRLIEALEGTARATVGLSATAACAGIIIGAIFATGLSFQVSQAAVQAAGGHLWVVLVITAVMALIMGMGMTASAVYITLLATVIPILITAGVPPLAAHMFAFYYGIVSNVTPPVALAAYAAAPLAGANPMATALQASRLGVGVYMLPLLFVYGPGLLLIGSPWEIVLVTFTAAAGLTALALAATGYLFTLSARWERILFFLAAGLLIVPNLPTDLLGLALFAVATISNLRRSNRTPVTVTSAAVAAAEDGAMAGGWLARLAAGRIAREAGRDVESLPAAPNSVADLLREETPHGGESEATSAALWGAWVTIALATLAIGYMGSITFHAIHPRWWIGGLAAVSTMVVVGGVACLRLWPQDSVVTD